MADKKDLDGACVILYTAAKVLLQKRDDRPRMYPCRWAIFGGEIKNGETPEAAVQRELNNELNIDLNLGDLESLGKFRVPRPPRWALVYYFRAPLIREFWDILLNLKANPQTLEREGNGLALFSHEEIDSLFLRCEDRVALERHFHGKAFGFDD